jgi:hypothetical protein
MPPASGFFDFDKLVSASVRTEFNHVVFVDVFNGRFAHLA